MRPGYALVAVIILSSTAWGAYIWHTHIPWWGWLVAATLTAVAAIISTFFWVVDGVGNCLTEVFLKPWSKGNFPERK